MNKRSLRVACIVGTSLMMLTKEGRDVISNKRPTFTIKYLMKLARRAFECFPNEASMTVPKTFGRC